MATENTTEFILYACPLGELYKQLKHFYAVSRKKVGRNSAHDYMPHCTLTGFFRDDPIAAVGYIHTFVMTVGHLWDDRPDPSLRITGLTSRPDWIGLDIESPWLEAIAQTFAYISDTPTRTEPIRPKSGLHLSLAYGFPPDQHAPLQDLAHQLVDPPAPGSWELRLYQRDAPKQWTCHLSHPL